MENWKVSIISVLILSLVVSVCAVAYTEVKFGEANDKVVSLQEKLTEYESSNNDKWVNQSERNQVNLELWQKQLEIDQSIVNILDILI